MATANAKDPVFEEFLDENRQNLIAALVKEHPKFAWLPRANVICLWLSDISVLQKLAHPEPGLPLDFMWNILLSQVNVDYPGILAGNKHNTLLTDGALQAKRDTSEADLSSRKTSKRQKTQTTTPYREKEVRDKALDRDNYMCVVSQSTEPLLEVAHIMPYKLNGTDTTLTVDEPWAWLTAFWGKENVMKWKAEIMEEEIFHTENVSNLMTLACHVHKYWGSASCAFRPIEVSKDKRVLEIAFHWLPRLGDSVKRSSGVSTEHPFGEEARERPQAPAKSHAIYHVGKKSVMHSGDIIKVMTDDPINHPLPSFELLKMMWHLTRIVAMQGAADEEEDDPSDEDTVAD